jgi:hypothetical protein
LIGLPKDLINVCNDYILKSCYFEHLVAEL